MKRLRITLSLLLSLLVTAGVPLGTQGQTITTIAGGIGDNLQGAVYGRLFYPNAVAVDGAGNVYISDQYNNRIRKLSPSGILTTIAGGGSGFTQGGKAIYQGIGSPQGLVLDASNNIYFSSNNAIYKIDNAGTIITVAGNPSSGGGFSGDGSAATTAQLNDPRGIAFDVSGNLFIADRGNNRVRKVNTSGIITTIAGGSTGALGDGGPAISANVSQPNGVAADAAGNIYIADYGHQLIRKVDASGIISTYAGDGPSGPGGSWGTPATASRIEPYGVSIDPSGNLFIPNGFGSWISKVTASGLFYWVAGNGSSGFSGDGGPATAGQLNIGGGYWGSQTIAIDGTGKLFIPDINNNRVRMVNTGGVINSIAGNNIQVGGFSGDGGDALLSEFSYGGVVMDTAGNIYLADSKNNRIRKVSKSGIISTVAGNGIIGFSGDGGPATNAELQNPIDVAMDKSGNLYIADNGTNHVRKISTSGIITTIAGGGSGGLGDGGPATAAVISVNGIAVDNKYNVYIADGVNNLVRKVTPAGIITSVAGNGSPGYSGDGGAATLAQLNTPVSVDVDKYGDLFISDYRAIRKVDTSGTISTLINGGGGRISCDSIGCVYFGGSIISRIDPYGYISTIAGTPLGSGYSGDNGPATAAMIGANYLEMCSNGHLLLVSNNFIRDVCCLSSAIDKPPLFTKGRAQTMSICKNAPAMAIDTFLTVNDGDVGNTVTWSVLDTPVHGKITGLNYVATSTGGNITPSSVLYAPDTGYVGTDVFKIMTSDGTDTVATTITVTIASTPNPGTITGAGSVCEGSSTSLGNSVPGGVWSASNTNVSVSSGYVTAYLAGSTTITYTVNKTCGSAFTTKKITINPATVVGAIKGPAGVCVGSSVVLSDSVSGGAWSSASPYISVNPGGLIIGYASGTAVINYTVTGVCGSATASRTMTVAPLPSAGSITGLSTICTGGSFTLSDAVPGGVWSSGAPGIATVGSTGVVTGVAAGGAVISYTVSNSCGSSSAVTIVNVVSSLPILPVTGHSSVCAGDTTTLHDATPGGTWSSSVTTVATINSSGVVTGVSPGLTAISYTASLGCGTSVAVFIIGVDHPVAAGTLTGLPSLCIGASTVLTTTVPGGTWSSVTGHAYVSPAGIITGISTGPDTVLYKVSNSCGTDVAKHAIGIYPVPNAGTITGLSAVCSGDSIMLSDAATGGGWSSNNISVATVDSTGKVKGIAGGVTIVSYTVATGCGTAAAAKSITVNAASGIITGVTTICTGNTTTLSNPVGGGTWSSSNTSVATVGTNGVVSGVNAGTTIITYSVIGGCGFSATTAIMTVGTLPAVAAITGSPAVCAGSSTLLNDVTPTGTWSSSNTSVATINSSGVVNGLTAGTTIISYTVSAPCGSTTVTYAMAVESFPSAGVISGGSVVCVSSTITLSDNIPFGSWSSSNTAVATITPTGIVIGSGAGTVNISYSVSNSCGVATTMNNITVNPLPDAGSIAGTPDVCTGTAITLSDAILGGCWSSSDVSVASVGSSSGVVNGVLTGSATITYAVTNSCGTDRVYRVISVHPLPDAGAISGAARLCLGSVDTLLETLLTGTWSSDDAGVAVVGLSTGVVAGMGPGTANIYYYVSNICGTAFVKHALTIETPNVQPIAGQTKLCMGTSVTLSDHTLGGVWSSDNAGIATIDAGGVLNGVSPGVANISYIVTNTCGANGVSVAVQVETEPVAGSLSGNVPVCKGNSVVLNSTVAGGSWSSSNVTTATIDGAGRLTGMSQGSVTVSYKVTNSCGSVHSTIQEDVYDAPDAGFISGSNSICKGRSMLLSDAVAGGEWGSNAGDILSVDQSGMATALQEGRAEISYMVSNSCGTSKVSMPVTVERLPYAGHITGAQKTMPEHTTTLVNEIPGGAWISSDTMKAKVDERGIVTGVREGMVTITYRVYNSAGCYADTSVNIVVLPKDGKGSIYTMYPNPATYQLTIGWSNEPDYTAQVTMIDMSGKKAYEAEIEMLTVNGSTVLNIDKVVSGMYIVVIRSATGYYTAKLVVL